MNIIFGEKCVIHINGSRCVFLLQCSICNALWFVPLNILGLFLQCSLFSLCNHAIQLCMAHPWKRSLKKVPDQSRLNGKQQQQPFQFPDKSNFLFSSQQTMKHCIVSIEAWTMALVALVQFLMDTMQMQRKKCWLFFFLENTCMHLPKRGSICLQPCISRWLGASKHLHLLSYVHILYAFETAKKKSYNSQMYRSSS